MTIYKMARFKQSCSTKIYFSFVWLITVVIVSSFNVQIATYGNINVYSLGAIPLIAPAIEKALNEIRSLYAGVFNLQHTFLFDKSAITCIDIAAQAERLIAEFYYNITKDNATDMIAMISPCCGEEAGIARLTYGWNVPTIFGTTTTATSFRNRIVHPQVIASGYGNSFPYIRFAVTLIRMYKWTNIFAVYDSSGLEIYILGGIGFTNILKSLPGLQVNINALNCSRDSAFTSLLTYFRAVGRNLWFFGHPKCLRQLMIRAAAASMTNGNYVYLTPQTIKNSSAYGTVTWQNRDEDDETAKEAFQSVLVMTELENKTVALPATTFEAEMIRRSAELYNYTYLSGDKPSVIVKTIYECFLMFAQVLNETLANKLYKPVARPGQLFDGSGFVTKFLNRTFNLPMGTIYIDSAGERAEELALMNFDKISGTFMPVMKQNKQTFALLKLNDFLWPSNWPVPNTPECGFSGTEGSCSKEGFGYVTVASVCGAVGGTLLLVCVVIIRFEIGLRDTSWDLNIELVNFMENQSNSNHPACSSSVNPAAPLMQRKGLATYRQQNIWLKKQKLKTTLKNSRTANIVIGKVRSLSHINLSPFIGILRMADHIWIASGFCSRGNLGRLMTNETVTFDEGLKKSLIADILEGLSYIHKSPVKFHGTLCDENCLIDHHFTAKIAETGFDRLFKTVFNIRNYHRLDVRRSVWIAPETHNSATTGTQAADIYACGILAYKILSELAVLDNVIPNGYTSELPDPQSLLKCEEELKALIISCWSRTPADRPTVTELKKRYFNTVGPARGSFIDKVLRRMNRYANDLEEAVGERTEQLLVERKKCDLLLLEMLPRKIVDSLRAGKTVDAECFESVTISFSDIVGFYEFVLSSPPFAVVAFLNESHTVFDRVINEYDVYKVETINDSYMVASGLPVRNGINHIEEICRMSLFIRRRFIERFSTIQMKIQTGIHTGACVAAVVGLKRPRYCLFGDTVNTASRMTSYGEENKIHLSCVTAAYVQEIPTLKTFSRGTRTIKGKGLMETFWLEVP